MKTWILAVAVYGAVTFLGETRQGLFCPPQEVLAACLVLEAGGEGAEGMQAVMNVIQNRAHGNPRDFYKTAIAPQQFSALNGTRGGWLGDFSLVLKKARAHALWSKACEIVKAANCKKLPDLTGGATHYHALRMKNAPGWAQEMRETRIVKNHRFLAVK